MAHDQLLCSDLIAERRYAYAKAAAEDGDWSAAAEIFEQALERASLLCGGTGRAPRGVGKARRRRRRRRCIPLGALSRSFRRTRSGRGLRSLRAHPAAILCRAASTWVGDPPRDPAGGRRWIKKGQNSVAQTLARIERQPRYSRGSENEGAARARLATRRTGDEKIGLEQHCLRMCFWAKMGRRTKG
jgi:hypothetical protein